jgi:hypothetical protein
LVVTPRIRTGYLQNIGEYDYNFSKTAGRNRETTVDLEYLYEVSSQRLHLRNDNSKNHKLAIALFADAVE